MKVYGVFPTIELFSPRGPDDRVRHCLSLIAALVADSLRADGDDRHFVVEPGADGDDPSVEPPGILWLDTHQALLERARRSADPYDATGGVIRSATTCRAATFGHDGQALLCLRHADAPPVSPDPALVAVEEQPDFLADFDLFDGWLPADFADAEA